MAPTPKVEVSLDAVIIAVTQGQPRILAMDDGSGLRLPGGALDTAHDATLELALRRSLASQTGLTPGYVEQLYTFGDRNRVAETPRRAISIAYLGLVEETPPAEGARWCSIYDLFPWEDHRDGRPDSLASIEQTLASTNDRRAQISFRSPWDGIRSLERYELMYESGLVEEHRTDSGIATDSLPAATLGRPMLHDHRRIVAVALSRLRGKLTYRPIVFELLPPTFTLLQLQRTVEAVTGVSLHKQNFRRLVEANGLVEGTGQKSSGGSGRPAELFRYRESVLLERQQPGLGNHYS